MIAHELEKIVHSLSPAEKKNFRLSAAGNEKEKDYLLLFDLLCKHNKNLAEVETVFAKKARGASFDNTVHYLFKVLTDQLVAVRIGQDKWYARHHAFMKARLCFERSLPGRAHHELKKTQQLAAQAQDHMLYYQAVREELNYLSDAGFRGMGEQEVVDLQMRSKQALKELHQIHEHHSLYELLRLRLLNEQIGLEGNGKMINDLVLGELGIISMGGRHLFESRKTHLLFQSFFLIHTKQYHSALNVFKSLNALFEENEALWNNPPYDNLSALDGILDNLYSIRYFHEMDFFTGKLEQLMARPYPEHFRNLCYQTFCLHRLCSMTGAQEFDRALAFIRKIREPVLLNTGFNQTDKQLQLLLFAARACFQREEYDEANRYVSFALNGHKSMSAALAYRACRLLHILVHYETGNTHYLDYEIRAFKRFYSKHGGHYQVKKLLFQTVSLNPRKCSQAKKKAAFEKILPGIAAARASEDEKPLLKYFDFCEWITGCYAQ